MLLVSFNPKRQVSMVGLTSSLRLHVASLQEGIKHCFPQATPAEHSVGSGGVSTSATPIPSPTTPSKSEVAVAEPSTKPCAPGFTRRQVWDCKFEVVSLRFNMGQQYHQKNTTVLGLKIKTCFNIVGVLLFTSHVHSPMLPCRCFCDELQRPASAGWWHRSRRGRT